MLRLGIAALSAALVAVVGLATPAAAADPIAQMEGGFTQTYGWGTPDDEVVVRHNPVTTPTLMGFDINHMFDKPFMRAVFRFDGVAVPSYRLQYVTRAEACGCTTPGLKGKRFLRIVFGPAMYVGETPVGEVLLVEDGAVVTMALTCTARTRAQFGIGLTQRVRVRTGEMQEVDPDGNQFTLIALDIRDPRPTYI